MAYFDNAATTFPKPLRVYEEMDRIYRQSSGSAGRGDYKDTIQIGKLVQDTRNKIKSLLHCQTKEVIFTPTATIALNIIIQGLLQNKIKNVYISHFEHNAVTRILHHYEAEKNIKVIKLPMNKDSYTYDISQIKYDFEAIKPDLVIVSHVSNVTGLIAPIRDIFQLAKKFDAYTVADMSQSAGLIDTEVNDIFDFAVFAGHKTLYGPTGISGFVMKPGINLQPILFGGTGYDSANQDMPDRLPEKFEMGTINTSGIGGLHAALEWIDEEGIENIWAKEKTHRQRLLSILENYSFIKIVGVSEEAEYAGIVSCLIEGISSDSAGMIFSERGISVRTGLQCAPLAHQFLNTYPAGTVRFSISYFTNEEDFAELINALDDIEENI